MLLHWSRAKQTHILTAPVADIATESHPKPATCCCPIRDGKPSRSLVTSKANDMDEYAVHCRSAHKAQPVPRARTLADAPSPPPSLTSSCASACAQACRLRPGALCACRRLRGTTGQRVDNAQCDHPTSTSSTGADAIERPLRERARSVCQGSNLDETIAEVQQIVLQLACKPNFRRITRDLISASAPGKTAFTWACGVVCCSWATSTGT